MASNYNSRGKPTEILVNKKNFAVIRNQESISEIHDLILFYEDQVPDALEEVREKDNISGLGVDFSYYINDRWTIYSEFAHLIGKTMNPYNENQFENSVFNKVFFINLIFFI